MALLYSPGYLEHLIIYIVMNINADGGTALFEFLLNKKRFLHHFQSKRGAQLLEYFFTSKSRKCAMQMLSDKTTPHWVKGKNVAFSRTCYYMRYGSALS